MNDKQQILIMLRAEFSRWEELLASMSEEQITAPRLPDNMSIKDVIAHVWAWQQLSIARLEAALHAREPEFHMWPAAFDPESEEATDHINAWIYQTYHDKSWSQVHRDWRAGFLRFLELGEAIPETDLVNAEKYPWLNGYALIAVLTGSFGHHHDDHLEPVLAWMRRDVTSDA